MSAVVTDEMVERAFGVLSRAIWHATGAPEEYLRAVARDCAEAILNPPEDRACLCGCPHERRATLSSMTIRAARATGRKGLGTCVPAPKPEQSSGNGGNGDETRDPRPQRPGGLQVAFGPAVNAWTAYLASATPLSAKEARKVAIRITTKALSAKQRERAKRARVHEFREAA